ncbi:uncharacterized protein LOC124806436 [Hydra vulgaris]|uniref:uncharacterized protein LOC124806436 n=1 Tax=Hydra vulgaris TaxID=6087 RepID=UPI001F5F7522|nr:uncharacterized protein LOC124806436 [Hydra vulgaris]
MPFKKKIYIMSDIVDRSVCNQNNQSCMFMECKANCGLPKFDEYVSNVIDSFGDDSNKLFVFDQWSSENAQKIEQPLTSLLEGCVLLRQQLPDYIRHVYIKRQQSAYFRLCRQNVSENELIIQMDFSENYTIMEQSEIQSAYWVHQQLTVFTAAVWSKNYTHSYAIVSDRLLHDKYAVLFIIKELLNCYHNICKLHFFTDGPSSPFKNSYVMTAMNNLYKLSSDLLEICWSFFATSLGKGAVDGIGGEIKRMIWTIVKSGKRYCRSLEDFVSIASEKNTKINVSHYL